MIGVGRPHPFGGRVKPKASPILDDIGLMELRTLLDLPSVIMSTWHTVMFARWRGAPTVDAVRAVRDAVRNSASTLPRFAGFNFVDAVGATQFDELVRKEISLIRQENAARQLAIATVIEGTGFFASTVRSVASGLAVMQREPFPSKNFQTLDEAGTWLAPLINLDGTEMKAAARAFRER